MSFKKFLKSPLGVGILLVTALATVYMNIIMPLIGENSRKETISKYPSSQEEFNTPGDTTDIDQSISAIDSSTVNELRKSGWKRLTSRDPFFSGNGNTVPVISKASFNSTPKIDFVQKTTARKKTPIPPQKPSSMELVAIAQGAFGNTALIGTKIFREGDSCKLGIITKITKKSVLLTTSRGVRELRIPTRTSGEIP